MIFMEPCALSMMERKMALDPKLETFIEVCEYMNFTKAADSLGLTQPAVSRQMKGLEEQYDVALFHYEAKKLSLTDAGRLLLSYAKTTRNDEEKLRSRLKTRAARPLYIGSTPTPGEFMLPPLLFSYLQKHPTPDVRLSVQNTEALLEKLDDGEIDLAFVEGNFKKSDYDHLLFSIQNFSPICARCLKFSASSIYDLLSFPLIVREPGSGNREILEYSLMRHNIALSDFSGRIEVNDIRVQKALVQQGAGIAFLFEAAITDEKMLQRIPIDGFPLQHEINIVWRKNSIFQKEYLQLARFFADGMAALDAR